MSGYGSDNKTLESFLAVPYFGRQSHTILNRMNLLPELAGTCSPTSPAKHFASRAIPHHQHCANRAERAERAGEEWSKLCRSEPAKSMRFNLTGVTALLTDPAGQVTSDRA